MATEKTINAAIAATNAFKNENSTGKFYLYINWTNGYITIHGDKSASLTKFDYDDINTPYSIFGNKKGKRGNGYWYGYFQSYLEAVGIAKLIADFLHRQSGEHLQISNSSRGICESGEKPPNDFPF